MARVVGLTDPSGVTWSNLLGATWVLAFGSVILTSLSLPISELLSVVWVLAFGLAGAVVAYARSRRSNVSSKP